MLKIEAIGSTGGAYKSFGLGDRTGWCAKVFFDCGSVRRSFIKPLVDYAKGNSVGSRGVYKTWVLSDGLYQVEERVSWKRRVRYFMLVSGSEMSIIQDGEAEEVWGGLRGEEEA